VIVRIFIKPEGRQWVDVELIDGVQLGALANTMQNEGYIVVPHALIPTGSILFIAAMSPLVGTKPNLALFPGGKDGA
jgi:hypothetical protein